MEFINDIKTNNEGNNVTHLGLIKNKMNDGSESRAGTWTSFGCIKEHTDVIGLTWDDSVLRPKHNTKLHPDNVGQYGFSIIHQPEELVVIINFHLRPYSKRGESRSEPIIKDEERRADLSERELMSLKDLCYPRLNLMLKYNWNSSTTQEKGRLQQSLLTNYKDEHQDKDGIELLIMDSVNFRESESRILKALNSGWQIGSEINEIIIFIMMPRRFCLIEMLLRKVMSDKLQSAHKGFLHHYNVTYAGPLLTTFISVRRTIIRTFSYHRLCFMKPIPSRIRTDVRISHSPRLFAVMMGLFMSRHSGNLNNPRACKVGMINWCVILSRKEIVYSMADDSRKSLISRGLLNERVAFGPINIKGCNTCPNSDISKASYVYLVQSEIYTKRAILKAEEGFLRNNFKMNGFTFVTGTRPRIPFSIRDYQPELDTSPLCNLNQRRYFQDLIGTLRWLSDLGRADIRYEISSLSNFFAKPRIGHLFQTLHIYKYLEMHIISKLFFTRLYWNHFRS